MGGGEHRKGLHQCMYVFAEEGPYPAIQGQQDGVTLDVPVDDALSMQVSQRLQHGLAHSGDLLFTQPAGLRGRATEESVRLGQRAGKASRTLASNGHCLGAAGHRG